jgi:hypothetical protein
MNNMSPKEKVKESNMGLLKWETIEMVDSDE